MTAPTEAEIRAAYITATQKTPYGDGVSMAELIETFRNMEAVLRLLDEARAEHRAARAEAEANRRDAEQGWAAFYALRKAVSAYKYPTLTQIVRTKDVAAAMQEPGRG